MDTSGPAPQSLPSTVPASVEARAAAARLPPSDGADLLSRMLIPGASPSFADVCVRGTAPLGLHLLFVDDETINREWRGEGGVA